MNSEESDSPPSLSSHDLIPQSKENESEEEEEQEEEEIEIDANSPTKLVSHSFSYFSLILS